MGVFVCGGVTEARRGVDFEDVAGIFLFVVDDVRGAEE
jgi:hypothetical protein